MVWRCVGFQSGYFSYQRFKPEISSDINSRPSWLRARLESMLLPDILVDAVDRLSPDFLRDQGIKALMLDLDDTLVASKARDLSPSYLSWLNSLKAEAMPLIILSNGSPKRVNYWSEALGLPAYALSGKPFLGFRRALKHLGTEASQTAMIGDQLFTDVLGAKLIGIKSILVKPLSPGLMPHTRCLRYVENYLLKGGGHGRSFYR
ncbi:MAG: YqeG family HAD IIIA-type phosphatase [Trueperaceae bacterium]|nr:YqeG family HAD IIIA-type phosphatase [Trueperaceae bacterium]